MPSKKEQLLESDDEGEGAIVNVSDTKKHLTRPGLPPHVALNFLDVLDSYGGPDCVSNQNRLIATVCNNRSLRCVTEKALKSTLGGHK
jgi:hypothetical protein